jgi:hypothetical protein
MARVVRRIGSEYTNSKVDDPKESHRGQLLASLSIIPNDTVAKHTPGLS